MQWLQDLIRQLLSIFPRLMSIQPHQMGVRCTPRLWNGMFIRELTPGWWLYWPFLQVIETIPVKTQVKDLKAQSIWTKDHCDLTISGAIRYRVRSAKKALLDVYDVDQNIQTVALGIIQEFARQRDLAELDVRKLEEEIIKGVRKESEGWGLYIERVYVTDIGRTLNVRLLQ